MPVVVSATEIVMVVLVVREPSVTSVTKINRLTLPFIISGWQVGSGVSLAMLWLSVVF